MSRWTHVVGSLYVEIHKELKDPEGYVKDKLKDAPKITGSEKDCDIFVNALSGYNTSTSIDCEHCCYGETIKNSENRIEGFTCDAPDDYQCPSGEYQTCLTITLVGDFRDRDEIQTKKEVIDFLDYLKSKKCGWDIDYYSITVNDEISGISTLSGEFYKDDIMKKETKDDVEWIKIKDWSDLYGRD